MELGDEEAIKEDADAFERFNMVCQALNDIEKEER